MTPDIHIENHGSIVLLQPLTPEGREAIAAVMKGNGEAMTFHGALVVEPRYVGPLVEGMLADGLGVEVLS